jgi:hypothetical protein
VGPPLDSDGGLQVGMVLAAARVATNAVPWRTAGGRPRVWARQRGPTPPDPSVAARRRRGRSLQTSPPAVERRECRLLSSINHRARTRLGLPALVHFSDAATPFGRPRRRGEVSRLGAQGSGCRAEPNGYEIELPYPVPPSAVNVRPLWHSTDHGEDGPHHAGCRRRPNGTCRHSRVGQWAGRSTTGTPAQQGCRDLVDLGHNRHRLLVAFVKLYPRIFED